MAKSTARKVVQKPAEPSPEESPPTTQDKLAYYFTQYAGLVFTAIGIAIVCLGYGKGWMHDTNLLMLALAVCLVGLFFHEFRPFNSEQILKEMQEQRAQQEADKND